MTIFSLCGEVNANSGWMDKVDSVLTGKSLEVSFKDEKGVEAGILSVFIRIKTVAVIVSNADKTQSIIVIAFFIVNPIFLMLYIL